MGNLTFFETISAQLSGSQAVAVFLLVVGASMLVLAATGRISFSSLLLQADGKGRVFLGVLGVVACVPAFIAAMAYILPSPSPTSKDVWTYKYVTSPGALVAELNKISPSAENLWIESSWPNLHFWYRGGDTGTRYVFKRVAHEVAKRDPTDEQFFRRANGVIPVGWIPGGSDFGYLQSFDGGAK
ncbi:hypothetical protein [Tahibacter amnicola]|uniref:DUF1109 domain-containing protein n=1 Tax=Tahibacter amnicola TaxID=2976241 RepID=A0ABY6B8Z5_9GAMM|nr:hypothetical protein [Tahibacter amnicola]UXI66257.1 hypothetical protein N4264_16035 [Tahibacter amnicola]